MMKENHGSKDTSLAARHHRVERRGGNTLLQAKEESSVAQQQYRESAAGVGIGLAVGLGQDNPDMIIKQLGEVLYGERKNDAFGFSVAMSSNGSRVAVGAPEKEKLSGHVRVFDGTGTDWVQGGPNLDAEAEYDEFGSSVALSSGGSRVAVGAPQDSIYGKSSSGYVRVFDWAGTKWDQIGSELNGENDYDEFGWSVALSSDGSRLVAGVPYNNATAHASGRVCVFDLAGTEWVQVAPDLDGEAEYDRFGWRVAISSDGSRVAVVAVSYGDGYVCFFDRTGTEWVQLGQDLNGDSVAMSSNGSRVAVGALKWDGKKKYSGHVRGQSCDRPAE